MDNKKHIAKPEGESVVASLRRALLLHRQSRSPSPPAGDGAFPRSMPYNSTLTSSSRIKVYPR